MILIGHYKELNFNSGIKSKIFGHFKNINYEAKNVDLYKKKPTTEFHGALGYLTQINLEKRKQLFSPTYSKVYDKIFPRKHEAGKLRLKNKSDFCF